MLYSWRCLIAETQNKQTTAIFFAYFGFASIWHIQKAEFLRLQEEFVDTKIFIGVLSVYLYLSLQNMVICYLKIKCDTQFIPKYACGCRKVELCFVYFVHFDSLHNLFIALVAAHLQCVPMTVTGS